MSTSPQAGQAAANRPFTTGGLLAVLVVVIGLLRTWTCICLFVGEEWNDVRLRPAWLIHDGLPLYAGLGHGPVTTWIYGPVTPLLMQPATLAPGIEGALLTAGILNAVLLAGSIAVACLSWPAPAGQRWTAQSRLLALGCALLLLPEYYQVFLFADNAVICLGLLSGVCLAHGHRTRRPLPWWLAAGFAAGALFAKLHGLAVIAGSLAWIWLAEGRSAAGRHTVRLAICCAAGAGATLMISAHWQAAWDQVVLIPSRLPMLETSRIAERVHRVGPHLGLLLLLPAVISAYFLKSTPRRNSGAGLAAIVWLAALPLGLAGIFTAGGDINSLHAAFILLPIALVEIGAAATSHTRRSVRTIALLSVGILGGIRLAEVFQRPHVPQLAMPAQAYALARRGGSEAWLPWRPLTTRLASGRHDHDEDGLHVRQLTRLTMSRTHLLAHLPPEWRTTFFQANGMNWSVALAIQGPDWQGIRLGSWLLFNAPLPEPKGDAPTPAKTFLPSGASGSLP